MPYFHKYTSAAPLAVFRVIFGAMILASIVRFWSKGWIGDLYIKPRYFFTYYGFEFIKPLGENTYLLFAICGLCAFFVALGFLYRLSAIGLFLSFTYIELIDKTTYLNHYYFVSLVCFVLIFLPAHVYFSFDAYRKRSLLSDRIPAWCIDSIRLLVCILYFYAGLAKINSDWLIHALPLKIWLPARNDMPVIGFLFNYSWVPFLFSWFGCLYDLSIGFLLWNKKTRLVAYLTVVVFHLLTAALFPIGMFPYVMIVTALIFFPPEFHLKILAAIGSVLKVSNAFLKPSKTYIFSTVSQLVLVCIFFLFFAFQLIFPFRYLLYPGELFWNEEGYRFSWRVMLTEKAGYAQFTVKDGNGNQKVVNNKDFLTDLQEKMVSTQPDMLLQYAHILRDYYAKNGFAKPRVYVDSYVALNGRLGKPIVFPDTDLAKETDSFLPKLWIIPFKDEIKGF